MSCHDIGRGLNSVVKVIIKEYDNGKFSQKTAKKLIKACRKGVHWCDGNEPEAVEYLREHRCGHCLKKMTTGEKLYSLWDISSETNHKYNVRYLDDSDENTNIVSYRLCEDCFDKILLQKSKDKNLGYQERIFIIDNRNDWTIE